MDELDLFKKNIDLREFAASEGYLLDKKKSSQTSSVMRNADGDKLVMAKDNKSSNYIYFSIRNPLDNGTIIDFLSNRNGGNLGEIRKILRGWLGLSRPKTNLPTFAPLKPASKDTRAAVIYYEKANYFNDSPFLEWRGLNRTLINSPRFKHCFKVDFRGNVLFPHYNRDGLCGFEKKNYKFTGYAGGGVKGLWSSICFKEDTCLVISESAIDGLSYQALHNIPSARFVSVGGSMNPDQLELLALAMNKMVGGEVHLAFDNDLDGAKMADQVRTIAPIGVNVLRPLPKSKDWNQELKNGQV
ncbi:toprim domain-containing protein [Desulfocastanea catecholica]